MYTQFNTSTGNTGSSSNLTNYLDKEQKNAWFNSSDLDIQTKVVTAEIDKMGRGGMKKSEWGFIEIEYNPSEKEQLAIIEKATGRTDVTQWNQLSSTEQQRTKEEFMEYVREAQDVQARNYEKENINSGADLKYFGKVETQRKYKGTDEEVKEKRVKQGQLKEGLNMHVHIIQHRKTADKKHKISPIINAKNISEKNPVKAKFNRNAFINKVEQLFDARYNYKRKLGETFEYRTANKFNRFLEKEALLNKAMQRNPTEELKALRDKIQNQSKVKAQPIKHKEINLDKEVKRNPSRGRGIS